MTRPMMSLCLLLSLLGAGKAWSEPPAAPLTPPGPSTSRTAEELAARRHALEDELRRVTAETDARARQLDPDSRLSSDQLFTLLQIREKRLGTNFDPTPVAVCFSLFGSLLTALLAWLWAADRKARRLHETVRLMVEKGAEIPPQLLAPPARQRPSDLRRGIILSATGLGLALLLAVLPTAKGAWSAGLTLLLIGLGHVLVWRLQQGRGALSSALAPGLES